MSRRAKVAAILKAWDVESFCEEHHMDYVMLIDELTAGTEFADGFHTMSELYEQRALYHALYVNLASSLVHHLPGHFDVTKSWCHHDGQPCFGITKEGERWFIVTMNLPNGSQVTQHYPEDMWAAFHIPEVVVPEVWDGHDSVEGGRRMRRFLGLSDVEA